MARIQTSRDTHFVVDNPRCPICAQAANVYLRKEPADLYEGWCERCGDVCIVQSAAGEAWRQGKAHLISAWLRRRPAGEAPALITEEGVTAILKDTPEYSVLEKLDLTLVQISLMSDHPGLSSSFAVSRDYPLVYAKDEAEVAFYKNELTRMGYLDSYVRVTAEGYKRLSEIQRTGRESGFAFVAMFFDASMKDLYEQAIEPAIRQAGYKPVRIDREQHTNRIDDEIIGRIRGSRFMVADFTGQRSGVYFEAGMMLGLGRTVIWMCRKEDLKNVHFDTRQYNFIDYEDLADAKKRLYDRIIAIEGEGPELGAAR